MTHIRNLCLVLLICVSLCACDNSNIGESIEYSQPSASTQETKHKAVASGLSIDALKSYADSSGVDNYSEVECDDGSTKFSFESSSSSYSGYCINGDVTKFSIYIDNVQANTSEEFVNIAYTGYQDIMQLTWNQLPSAFSVDHIMRLYYILSGNKDITLGEAASVITDTTLITADKWSISAIFDTDKNDLTIYFSYS